MKYKLKKLIHKFSKIFLALLMALTCINFSGIQDVSALTMNYQSNSALEKSVTIDGLWGDSSSHTYKLKMGGEYGFCLDMGKSFSGGKYYDRNSWSGVTGSTNVKKIMNWFYDSPQRDYHFWLAQTAIWGIQKGRITNPYDDFQTIWEELDKVYMALQGTVAPGGSVGPDCRDMMNASSEGEFYIYTYESGYQRVATNVKGYKPTLPIFDVEESQSYSITDQIELNINKTDVETGNGLGDVDFELYRDNVKIANVKTNAQGKASHTFEKKYTETATATAKYYDVDVDKLSPKNREMLGDLPTSETVAREQAKKEALAKAKAEVQKLLDEKHTYKAVETKTREEYYLNPDSTTTSKEYASGDGSGSVSFSFTNKRQLGTVDITKLDTETNNPVDTAVYGLYAKTNIVHPDGHTGVLYNANDLVGTFPATNGQGKSTLDNLYLGQYYVKEITAPHGYLKSEETYDVTLSYAGQTVSVTDDSATVSDKVQRASLSFIKKDSELENGKDENIFDGNHDGAQGDATRVGATYGLYARENITHADGTTGIVQYNQQAGSINEIKLLKGTDLQVKNVKANAGTLLATAKTDSNGEISFGHLYNGKYYVKEIEPSEGYLLDPTEYDFDLSYTNQSQEIVSKEGTVFETVKKQGFEVLKVGHVTGSSTVVPPLQGVEFTVKLESDVQRMGWDDAPTYDILITDEKGFARSIELPYGTYRVKETKPAPDYDTAEDFFVEITEDNRDPQEFTNKIIADEVFSALIKAVKLDQETGKTVALPNTTFKIKALTDVFVDGKEFKAGEYIGYWNWNILDGFYTDTWKTNDEGFVIINEKLSAGEYELEEIHAPHGYVLDTTPVKFKVTNKDMHGTADDGKTPIITTYKSDVSVKGQINVEKRGEVLVGYENGNFVYEERGLATAEYKIRAKEDILDPSNDGTVLYKKGTIVDTIVTGANGKATSKKLPLGTYEVYESKAPHGMVLNPEVKTVILEYADENIPVVFEDIGYVNERQRVDLSIIKKDTENKVLLEGAEFDFIANEDITNLDGDVIVTKGTVLAHVVTDEKGKAIVDMDLPLDIHFVFVETKAPIGFELSEVPIEVTTTYEGQDYNKIDISKEAVNKETEVVISKIDMTTSEELEGNTLTIFEKGNEGSTFETWVSGKEPHKIKNLNTETRYVLRETSSAKGFYLATDIEFELDKYGKLYIVNEEGNLVKVDENKIVMKNDLVKGKLEWNKTGEIFAQTVTGQTEYGKTESPVWEKSNLLQSEITIYAAEDITLGNGETYYKKDEKIQTLESDFEPVQSQELLVGKYYYVETKTPHGYITDNEKHYFEIKDNQSSELQIVKEELYNKRPTVKVEFNKIMEDHEYHENKDAYKDVLFGIYAREDIYDYKGNVAITNGTMIATSGIDEKGQLTNMPDLPNGVYFLKELQTNKDYVLDTNEYNFEIGYQGSDVPTYQVVIGNKGQIENKLKRGNVEITKVGVGNGEKNILLTGAEFNISADEDMKNIIATVKTGDDGIARFENLEVGIYYIQEVKTVDGYLLDDTIHKVEVTNEGETVQLTVENEYALTDIQVNKVDEQTNKPIISEDFEFTMYADKELTQVLDVVHANTEDGTATFKDVKPLQTVYIKETKAPVGYKLSDEVKVITVDENLEGYGDVHSFVYMNSLLPVVVVKTNDTSSIAMFSVLALAGLSGMICFKRKKKEQ